MQAVSTSLMVKQLQMQLFPRSTFTVKFAFTSLAKPNFLLTSTVITKLLQVGGPSFPVDLLLCRPEAASQRYDWGDPFIREALDHGEMLHG